MMYFLRLLSKTYQLIKQKHLFLLKIKFIIIQRIKICYLKG